MIIWKGDMYETSKKTEIISKDRVLKPGVYVPEQMSLF